MNACICHLRCTNVTLRLPSVLCALTPTALTLSLPGSTISPFDGESQRVRDAFELTCPRLTACVRATGALPEIVAWERHRPDTFSLLGNCELKNLRIPRVSERACSCFFLIH